MWGRGVPCPPGEVPREFFDCLVQKASFGAFYRTDKTYFDRPVDVIFLTSSRLSRGGDGPSCPRGSDYCVGKECPSPPVTFVHPTQPVEIFVNFSWPFDRPTLAIR